MNLGSYLDQGSHLESHLESGNPSGIRDRICNFEILGFHLEFKMSSGIYTFIWDLIPGWIPGSYLDWILSDTWDL